MFHVLIGMGDKGSQSAITVVRKALVKSGMTSGSSVITARQDVDVGKLFREKRYDIIYRNPEKIFRNKTTKSTHSEHMFHSLRQPDASHLMQILGTGFLSGCGSRTQYLKISRDFISSHI